MSVTPAQMRDTLHKEAREWITLPAQGFRLVSLTRSSSKIVVPGVGRVPASTLRFKAFPRPAREYVEPGVRGHVRNSYADRLRQNGIGVNIELRDKLVKAAGSSKLFRKRRVEKTDVLVHFYKLRS